MTRIQGMRAHQLRSYSRLFVAFEFSKFSSVIELMSYVYELCYSVTLELNF